VKNKPTEIKNIKIHAHIYINPFFGGSRGLYPSRDRSICSHTCCYVVFHVSHD